MARISLIPVAFAMTVLSAIGSSSSIAADAGSTVDDEENTILDSRVFLQDSCDMSPQKVDRQTSVSPIAGDLASIAIGQFVRFSARAIKNIGEAKSKKLFANHPLYLFQVGPGQEVQDTDTSEDDKPYDTSGAGAPVQTRSGSDSRSGSPVREGSVGNERGSDSSQQVSINPELRCVVFVHGRFGSSLGLGAKRWLDRNSQRWGSKLETLQVHGKAMMLADEPLIYFEGELIPNSDATAFRIEARHFKVSQNQNWSLVTRRRDMVLAVQFADGAIADGAIATAATIDERSEPGKIDGATSGKAGFALGTFAFADAEAPIELGAAALAGKSTGWMFVDKKKAPALAALASAERDALKSACKSVYQKLVAVNGTRPKNGLIDGIVQMCREVSSDLAAAKAMVMPALSKQSKRFLGMAPQEPADLWALSARLERQIAAADRESNTSNNPAASELRREKELIEAVIVANEKLVAYQAKDARSKERKLGYPVDLTVGFIETRSAVQWLVDLGTSIEGKADDWAKQISDAVAPSAATESQAITARLAAQREALEAYGSLVEANAGYSAETDVVQRKKKYYILISNRIGYQDKLRLFLEKGGSPADLPPVPDLPAPPN